MDKDIKNIAKSFVTCQQHKHAPTQAPLQPWTWPWRHIHIDFVGPFMGTLFLVIVDAHSKWPEVFEMKSTSALNIKLQHLFASYGLPEQVASDNGPQFTSEYFAQFKKKNNI